MLEISHNSASIARGCWKKFYWTYKEKLTPKARPIYFTTGEIIHDAFEQYHKLTPDPDVIKFIDQRYSELLTGCDPNQEEDLRLAKYTNIGMWMYWPWKDLSEFEEDFSEKEFKVTIPGLRGVRLVGRVDGLVKMNGKWWIRELKTTGLTPNQFKGRMKTSYQVSGYVYAMRKLGFPVEGVMFEIIKKPLLRKRVNDSVDDFGRRIMSDYQNDGNAPENARKAFSRVFEYRSGLQMEQFVTDTKELVRDIRTRQRLNNWYRNPDYCWSFNSECQFCKICFMDKPDEMTLKVYYDRRG